jgi:catechol 2,3-dioxygenase
VLDHGYAVDHATDHGATVSAYLEDPDGIGIELYTDRSRCRWTDAGGRPVVRADRIPVDALLDPEQLPA